MIDLECLFLRYDVFDRPYCILLRREFGACERCTVRGVVE